MYQNVHQYDWDNLQSFMIDLDMIISRVSYTFYHSNNIAIKIIRYMSDLYNVLSDNSSKTGNKMNGIIQDTQIESNIVEPQPSCRNIIKIIKILVNSKIKKDEYKITSAKLLFTYEGVRLNKVELYDFIFKFMKNKGRLIEDCIISHEYCKEENIYHTHIYFKLDESFRILNRKWFIFNDVVPNIEKVLHSTINIEKVLRYLLEKDIEPYTNLSDERIEHIKDNNKVSKTLVSNLKCIPNITRTQTIIVDKVPKLDVEVVSQIEPWTFTSWQKYLLNVIENKVDISAFYWFWEPINRTGKTKLTNYISTNYNNVFVFDTSDTYKNLLDNYRNIILTYKINIVIFDLSKK